MENLKLLKINESKNIYCIINNYNELDYINTRVIIHIQKNYSKKTFRQYTNNIINFLNWLNENTENILEKKPYQIRSQITYYLCQNYQAKIVNKINLEIIHIEKTKHSSVSSIISSLKLYFSILISFYYYKEKNPLSSDLVAKRKIRDTRRPLMPLKSGIRIPDESYKIIKNHYIINNKQWTPDIVCDSELSNNIFSIIHSENWKLRDIIITRLLFETGARISEICGITIHDWWSNNFKNGSPIYNKGSFNVRTKFLIWSDATTILIQKYFNNERFIQSKRDLDWYKRTIDIESLKTETIFLSCQGNTYKENSFRDIYWNPTLKKHELEINIHKVRHWYVTTNLKIYEEHYSDKQSEQLKEGLISYIGWKSGKNMLDVYNHHKNKKIFIDANNKYLESISQPIQSSNSVNENDVTEEDTFFSKLMRLQK